MTRGLLPELLPWCCLPMSPFRFSRYSNTLLVIFSPSSLVPTGRWWCQLPMFLQYPTAFSPRFKQLVRHFRPSHRLERIRLPRLISRRVHSSRTKSLVNSLSCLRECATLLFFPLLRQTWLSAR